MSKKNKKRNYWWNRLSVSIKSFRARALSSDKVLLEILGAMLNWPLMLSIILIALPCYLYAEHYCYFEKFFRAVYWTQSRGPFIATLLLFDVMWVVHKLTPIFSLRRQEMRITVSQIFVLVAFGGWLIATVITAGLNEQSNLAIAIIGCILGWIFQDTVKSVVAFVYVRINDMIHINDWIQVDSRKIDGCVKSITLTMVTVENWDTTLTSFPTYLLHSDDFRNLQPMLNGETHGRRMFIAFTIDSGWIQPVSKEDAEYIVNHLDIDDYFKNEIIRSAVAKAYESQREVLNIHLFRLYIRHWLMVNPKISRLPRLVVRFLEPTECGVPLQIYAYIIDLSLEAFEWVQSEIIEHVIQSMGWFNLRLYQSPSGYDASNSNIFLSPETANYKNY